MIIIQNINIRHRFVYQAYEEKMMDDSGDVEFDGSVKILSIWSHYDRVRVYIIYLYC
ncbi:MAG: hypothetical protein K0S04_285 [Herbinix sp.]|nr:hypothetical protein [Herbinix sp.]